MMQCRPCGHCFIGRVVGSSNAQEATRTAAHDSQAYSRVCKRKKKPHTRARKTKALCGPPVNSPATHTYSYRQATLKTDRCWTVACHAHD